MRRGAALLLAPIPTQQAASEKAEAEAGEACIESLLHKITLEEKVRMLMCASTTPSSPSICSGLNLLIEDLTSSMKAVLSKEFKPLDVIVWLPPVDVKEYWRSNDRRSNRPAIELFLRFILVFHVYLVLSPTFDLRLAMS